MSAHVQTSWLGGVLSGRFHPLGPLLAGNSSEHQAREESGCNHRERVNGPEGKTGGEKVFLSSRDCPGGAHRIPLPWQGVPLTGEHT